MQEEGGLVWDARWWGHIGHHSGEMGNYGTALGLPKHLLEVIFTLECFSFLSFTGKLSYSKMDLWGIQLHEFPHREAGVSASTAGPQSSSVTCWSVWSPHLLGGEVKVLTRE